MNNYLDSLKTSRKSILIADHMLTQTYPLIKDPKLLIAVLDNVFLSMSSAMDALVFHERELKTIPPFHNSFESKFDVLKLKLAGPRGINKSYISLIRDLKSILAKHKASPVEFIRKEKFIICSEEYDITSLSLDQLKKFIAQAREFLKRVNSIIGEEND